MKNISSRETEVSFFRIKKDKILERCNELEMKNCSNYKRVWSHRSRQEEGERGCAWHGRFIFFTPPATAHGGWMRCFNILIGRRNGRFRDLAFYNDILCFTFRSVTRLKPCNRRKSTTRNNLFRTPALYTKSRAFLSLL